MEGGKVLIYPTLIASYPRSGSTYLRFLLANLAYPRRQGWAIDGCKPHELTSVNKHIPTIESKDEILKSIPDPLFYKTHQLRFSQNVVFLHRHVGDCLVSEYHYHVKYHDYEGNINEFMENVGYGENWRNMIDHYYPCRSISFENLINHPYETLVSVTENSYMEEDYKNAIISCTFDYLQSLDSDFFRSGKIGQWQEQDEEIQQKLIEHNWKHLKILGYKI